MQQQELIPIGVMVTEVNGDIITSTSISGDYESIDNFISTIREIYYDKLIDVDDPNNPQLDLTI